MSNNSKNVSVLSALHQPFFDQLQNSKKVFLAGCGGGYDVFSALPLYFALQKCGIECHLGNLAFTDHSSVTAESITEFCFKITHDTQRKVKNYSIEREEYFPELFISRWFKEKEGVDVPVYLFVRSGQLAQLRESYSKIIDTLGIDTVIVCDGGTDSLMFGLESGLGTPQEDMCTLAAVNSLNCSTLQRKFLACIGFGVDCYHGVCHSDFLQNVATVQTQGGFLGSFSLLSTMPEAQKFRDIYLYCQPLNSIVSNSILSATEGRFGNYHGHTKDRTKGSTLYISALMSQYWAFDLPTVVKNIGYIDANFLKTNSMIEISKHINQYRSKNSHLISKKTDIPY